MNIQKRILPAPIYIVSGGRGIAGNNLVQSLLIQYPENDIPLIIVPHIADEDQVFDIVMKAKTDGGLIAHTMVNPDLRIKINTICAGQLIAHRKKRLLGWNNHQDETYIDERAVREEIRKAMFTFDKGGFTVINVSNKPIESTANEILNIMSKRFSYRGRKLESPYHNQKKD